MTKIHARVRQALADVRKAAGAFLAVGDRLAKLRRENPLQNTVRQLLMTVSNSMRSVLILIEHGCGTDALKIARTMFETAVNIHYLEGNPDALQDYVDFQWIKKKRHYEYLEKTAPAQAKAMDEASLAELNAEYERVSPRFMGRTGRIRNRWHKSDHREIARSVGGEVIYGGIYPFISSLTHMDVLGLMIARNARGEIENAPSTTNLALGLQIAIMSYALALTAANQVLGAACDREIQSAFEQFKTSVAVRQTVAVWDNLGEGVSKVRL